ncbi:MAG: hypothetical protein BAA01_07330 [Bacillus thermozeamaize]|uniref:Uncharacterized protein n=1 Tax=Bacillus thermozeamaize TaxID=230954 RepID=A0A1Y3PTW0_9BACI|nr:MAG: hypothetical protein BAA01_07330 [Bacillus thermozeamaize]
MFNLPKTQSGIIVLMTALLQALKRLRADERMIRSFEKIMVNGHLSFWILAVVTYFISLFFWPTPAVPLVAAILIPAALVQMGHTFIPENPFFGAFGLLIIGMLTGLDGSGFSGLPLTEALSGALGQSLVMDPTTLAAIGQMGAIWVGGGTLIAWSSLVAVAGFTRVPVLDLARKNFLPVIAGLVLSTLFAILFY